jgi:hypothetical protein
VSLKAKKQQPKEEIEQYYDINEVCINTISTVGLPDVELRINETETGNARILNGMGWDGMGKECGHGLLQGMK